MDEGFIKLDAAHTLSNLTYSKFRSAIVEESIVESLFWMVLEDCLQYNTPIFHRVSAILRNLLIVPEPVKSKLIMEDKFLDVLFKVTQYPEDDVQLNAAIACYHVANNKRTQTLVVRKGECTHHYACSLHVTYHPALI